MVDAVCHSVLGTTHSCSTHTEQACGGSVGGCWVQWLAKKCCPAFTSVLLGVQHTTARMPRMVVACVLTALWQDGSL
jgi:hypothetical protein